MVYLMEHIVATVTLDHIFATMALDHTVEAMTLNHIVATTLDTIVVFENIVAFIPFVALMSSSRTEKLWNFNVLQRVYLPILFTDCLFNEANT
jgi:hypothetical protein